LPIIDGRGWIIGQTNRGGPPAGHEHFGMPYIVSRSIGRHEHKGKEWPLPDALQKILG